MSRQDSVESQRRPLWTRLGIQLLVALAMVGIGFFVLLIGAGPTDNLTDPITPDFALFWAGVVVFLGGLVLYGVTWRKMKKLTQHQ